MGLAMLRALRFDKLPGLAHDISVGPDGSIWVIGTNRVGSGTDCGVMGWDGRNWADLGGGGVRIASGPDGAVWVLNSAGEIYVWQRGAWTGPLPGGGIDIAVGARETSGCWATDGWESGAIMERSGGTAGIGPIWEVLGCESRSPPTARRGS